MMHEGIDCMGSSEPSPLLSAGYLNNSGHSSKQYFSEEKYLFPPEKLCAKLAALPDYMCHLVAWLRLYLASFLVVVFGFKNQNKF